MSKVIVANLDDIVFRSRNRDYGAYVLRRVIPKHLRQAALIAVLLLSAFVVTPIVISIIKGVTAGESLQEVQEEVVLADLNDIVEEEKKDEPPPPPPPPPPLRSQVRFVPPKVVEVDEADPEQEIIDVDTVKADLGLQNIIGDDNADPQILDLQEIGTGTAPVELAKPKDEDPPDEFVFLEKNPEPVNLDQLKKLIEYPQVAKDAGISGRVVFRVLIDKEGRYVKHKVMRSPHKWLTESCEKHLPKIRFTPGIQAGKPVPNWVTVPFDFKLE